MPCAAAVLKKAIRNDDEDDINGLSTEPNDIHDDIRISTTIY